MALVSTSTELRRGLAALGAVATVLLLAAPFFLDAYLMEIILTGVVFGMIAVSWNLLAGYAGQVSLGHAAFFGIGAYVSAWITTPAAAGFPGWLAPPSPVGVPIAILAGGVAAALLALVTGPAMFRLRGHYFAIGTLALGAIIQVLLNNARTLSGGATGYYVNPGLQISLFGKSVVVSYFIGVVALVAMVVVTYYVVPSKLGLGMRAIHGDEEAADSLGVNPLQYKMYAFLISTLFAGIAGAVYAQYTLYINPSSTLAVSWTIDALVIVVLGGMGTMAGPLLGAGIFLVLDTWLADVAGGLATTVEGLILILFVIFLPNGIYGYLADLFGGPGGLSLGGSDEGEAEA